MPELLTGRLLGAFSSLKKGGKGTPLNKGEGEKNKSAEMRKKNKELLMNSKHLEKQEPLLCCEVTQNQVYKKGGGEMEESNRKTVTQDSRPKEMLSLGSYLTHAPELSQSL